MIAALLSDVHTNPAALAAVVGDLERWSCRRPDGMERRVEALWGVGDWLGYGDDHHPRELWSCISESKVGVVGEILREPSMRSVVGNNDLAALASGEEFDRVAAEMNGHAAAALARQRVQMEGSARWQEGLRQWLGAMPYVLSPAAGVYLAHGAFIMDKVSLAPYRYTPVNSPHEIGLRKLAEWLGRGETGDPRVRSVAGWERPRVLITGHTHTQMVWQRGGAGASRPDRWPIHERGSVPRSFVQESIDRHESVEWELSFAASPDNPIWINPGSVAMPRGEGDERAWQGMTWAKYAILDWQGDGGTVWLRWVPFTPRNQQREGVPG